MNLPAWGIIAIITKLNWLFDWWVGCWISFAALWAYLHCAYSGSKLSAPAREVFWHHFCTTRGGMDAPSIFKRQSVLFILQKEHDWYETLQCLVQVCETVEDCHGHVSISGLAIHLSSGDFPDWSKSQTRAFFPGAAWGPLSGVLINLLLKRKDLAAH